MRITWHGHSFFELDCAGGKKVIIDPYVTPFTNARLDEIKPDLVLITHGHNDHMGSVVQMNAPTVAVFELQKYLLWRGVTNVTGLNVGGSLRTGGIGVTMLPAIHSGGIGAEELQQGGAVPRGAWYGGPSVGYLVDDGQRRVYHAGDTCLFGDMKTVIGEVFQPDTALLPIGGYYTMDPKQAAIAVEWLGVRDVFPMHYNTFDEIRQDPNEFARLVGGIAKVHVPTVDQSVIL